MTKKKSASKTKTKNKNKVSARARSKKTVSKKRAAGSASEKPRTQGEVKTLVQEALELTPKQTRELFPTLQRIVLEDLKSRGKITLPGIGRFTLRKKPARPARKGVNPFTGEEMMFKARPARTVAKIAPVKALKDAVSSFK